MANRAGGLRPLGDTGLQVSGIGLGLAALGRPGYVNLGHAEDLAHDYDVAAMRRRTAEVLDAATGAGVRYVDAARSYGRAEEFLAAWLDGRSDDSRPVIGSKWGYAYTAEWQVDADVHEEKEHSRARLAQQLAETTQLLANSLDLYQAHSVTFSSGLLDDDALLDDLAALRARGVAVGLSLSGADQGDVLDAALGIERDGRRLFQTVQATWNVLEPSAGPALARARDVGLGVIVKEAVANGRLTPRGDVDGSPLARIAEREQVGVDAVAIAAALAQPFVDVVLSGAATVAHLRSNLDATRVALTDADRTALADMAETPAAYWDARSSLEWS